MRQIWMAGGFVLAVGWTSTACAGSLTPAAIEAAVFASLPDKPAAGPVAEVVKAEVLLSRARISPGAIDGIGGDNFRKAVRLFQKMAGLPDTGRLDQATWNRLTSDKAPVLNRYTITAKDAAGPFTRRIPTRFEQQSRLERLGFRDIREALAERFHLSPGLLDALNRGTPLAARRDIEVPAVDGPPPPAAPIAAIVVDKTDRSVEAFGQDGQLLATFPVSIGSEEKPAPSGRFEIRRIVHRPDYTYKPQYAFKGVKSTTPFRIAPGPNNPVGSVWIDLSFEGYGIHGTPEPERIGKTESHGCIRLTNWDAERLAGLAQPGTPVFFQDTGDNPLPPTRPPAGAPAPVAAPPAPASLPQPAAAPVKG